MWLLVIALCVSADAGPACSTAFLPVTHLVFQTCEDSAVLAHDALRAAADAAGVPVLVLDTRCLRVNPAEHIPAEIGR